MAPSSAVDETYIRVRGRWRYLYQAIDRDGALVDVMLSEHRDLAAARAFFRLAKAVTGVTPDRVTTDGHDAYPRAIRTRARQTGAASNRPISSKTDKSRTIVASRIDVDRCLDYKMLYQRHATAAAMTNYDPFCDADPICANMFPPQAATGGYAENRDCPRCPGNSLSAGDEGRNLPNSRAQATQNPSEAARRRERQAEEVAGGSHAGQRCFEGTSTSRRSGDARRSENLCDRCARCAWDQ